MTNFATAQSILDAANAELGLPSVTFGASSTDQTGRQASALMNTVGKDLQRMHDWQILQNTATFTGDGTSETFALPSAYGRMVNQTQWDTTAQRPMAGPVSPQTWGWLKYGLVNASGFLYRYRILNELIYVNPIPADGEEFAFTYISKNWVLNTALVGKTSITAGTDVPRFDERLMVCGLKTRLWGQKGFDTTIVQSEFNRVFESERGATQGASVINLSRSGGSFLLSMDNVAEGSW